MDRTADREPEPIFRPDNSAQSFLYQLYSWLQPAFFALTVLMLVTTFLGRMIGVKGNSMLPTLQDRNMVILRSAAYTPRDGDVVVLATRSFRDNTPIIKRVIATGGEEVEVDYGKNQVKVNGQVLSEPYLDGEMPMRRPAFDNYDYPITVPEGHVFVMGDNRNNSSDSRLSSIGMVDERCVLGKAVWVLVPFGSVDK